MTELLLGLSVLCGAVDALIEKSLTGAAVAFLSGALLVQAIR